MEKTFTCSQSVIHYTLTGHGTPVILLHGFGEDSSIWKHQKSFLEKFCQLLIPDLPGSGKSEPLTQKEPSLEDFADCIYQLAKHEQIDKAIILGHSMGGYITLALAEKYPSFTRRFGLVNSTAFADSEDKIDTRKKGIALMKEYGSYAFLKNTIPNLFSNNFKKTNHSTVQDVIEAGKNFSPQALIQYYYAMINRPNRTNTLRNTTSPVLFIIGKEDVAAPLADLEQQIDLPPQPVVHILDNVGHMSMLEATDEVNRILHDFINS